MTQFFAQPYDLSATGFYFETEEQYREKITTIRNDYGQPVEEFEIQFIDGERIDAALANAWGLNQANILRFMEIEDEWGEDQKQRFIIAVGECAYSFDPETVDPNDFDVDLYFVRSMRDLAEEFVAEGLFGPVPEAFRFYIDYDAIAGDLAVDYAETDIAGDNIIYRCG
ncbi:MAG: antirestriction protein ArdA [Pseudomonadota bacterium]